MIYKTNFGNVDFYNFQYQDKIAVSLSGGIDSALAFYLTCKEVNDTTKTVLPFTGVDENCFAHEPCAANIVAFMKKTFPNVNILDHETHYYQRKDINESKKSYHREYEKSLNVHMIVYGLTKNPPSDLLNLYEMTGGRDTDRDNNNFPMGYRYFPFQHIDKRAIAELYDKFNLKTKLLPLTFSCVEPVVGEPCEKCWWCKEKFWAFGVYK